MDRDDVIASRDRSPPQPNESFPRRRRPADRTPPETPDPEAPPRSASPSLATSPRSGRQIAQRTDRPLPRSLRSAYRLHQQVGRVGALFVALDRLADEHEDLYTRDFVAPLSSLFASHRYNVNLESTTYERLPHHDGPFSTGDRRSWAKRRRKASVDFRGLSHPDREADHPELGRAHSLREAGVPDRKPGIRPEVWETPTARRVIQTPVRITWTAARVSRLAGRRPGLRSGRRRFRRGCRSSRGE